MADPIDPTQPDLPAPGSGEEPRLPTAPGSGEEPRLPSPPGDPAVAQPTEPLPVTPTEPPTLPPTEAIPATPVAGAAAGVAGGAATDPTGARDTVLELEEERPWYRTPLGIAGIIAGVVILLALLGWLIWGGGDDDPEPGVATLELTAIDPSGAPIDRGYIATVEGPAASPTAFEWVLPSAGTGSERGANTGGDGSVTFSWAPDDSVDDPESWESRVTVVETVPAGITPPGPTVDCVLRRIDEQNSTVTMTVTANPPDVSVDQIVAYEFENHVFLSGDLVTCELVNTPPGETTTTTSSTVPETTTTTTPDTTAPETTVPPTTAPETTTTVPETTVPATTVPDTTTTSVVETTTTLAPLPATAYDALQADGSYATFLSLVDQVATVDDLLRGADPVTVLAPTDDALAGVTPPTDPAELEQLLLSHIVDGEALASTLLFDGRDEIDVASGGTQPVDAAALTVADVAVDDGRIDVIAENGVIHGLSGVLPVAAP